MQADLAKSQAHICALLTACVLVQVLRMLLGQGDQYSGYEDIPLANVQWVPMTKSVRVKNTEAVLDAMLETSREQNHKPHRRLAHNTPHSL